MNTVMQHDKIKLKNNNALDVQTTFFLELSSVVSSYSIIISCPQNQSTSRLNYHAFALQKEPSEHTCTTHQSEVELLGNYCLTNHNIFPADYDQSFTCEFIFFLFYQLEWQMTYGWTLNYAQRQRNSLDPGFSTSLTIWVMPALYPRKAVNLQGFVGSSLGKAFTA